jgi:hypothetical protein
MRNLFVANFSSFSVMVVMVMVGIIDVVTHGVCGLASSPHVDGFGLPLSRVALNIAWFRFSLLSTLCT